MIDLLNFKINNILDIGANVGDFSTYMSGLFSQAYILMIEANQKCEENLRLLPFDYKIAVLSDINKWVDFYFNETNAKSTGNSYYLEDTKYFENNYITQKIYTHTLDQITEYIDRDFDFIKLDTQGSELDILKGGLKTISKSKFILVECSTIKERLYNNGSPHSNDVIEFMKNNGFQRYYVVEEHKWWEKDPSIAHYSYGEIFQKDFMFIADNVNLNKQKLITYC